MCTFCADLLGKICENFLNRDSNRKSTTTDLFALVHFRSMWDVMSSFWSPEEPLDFSHGANSLNFEHIWLKMLIFEPTFRFRNNKKIEKKAKFKNPEPQNPPNTT